MNINICKLHPNAKIPTYATDGAACMDLYAATVNDYDRIGDVVYRGHPVIVDTGLAFDVPPGWMLKIHPGSPVSDDGRGLKQASPAARPWAAHRVRRREPRVHRAVLARRRERRVPGRRGAGPAPVLRTGLRRRVPARP